MEFVDETPNEAAVVYQSGVRVIRIEQTTRDRAALDSPALLKIDNAANLKPSHMRCDQAFANDTT
ncbi:MAG: hypothetical protein BWY06_03408 [Candidatus Latescibacteria bacterium ADurb.Bin168]|nr:MAG: hypothetical protein BWY06_03408 [Candidatus Latescibacteria bacterium ADurb.Bin168]